MLNILLALFTFTSIYAFFGPNKQLFLASVLALLSIMIYKLRLVLYVRRTNNQKEL